MITNDRQLLRYCVVAGVLFVATMLTMTAYTLARLRSDAMTVGLEIASTHARSFEDFVTQNLRMAELASSIATRPDVAPDPQKTGDAFVALLRHTPFIRSLSLLDENGRVIASSNTANLGLQVSAEGFLPLAAGDAPVLRVGEPWLGRDLIEARPVSQTSNKQASDLCFIPVYRAFRLGEKRFALLALINPDYIVNHLSQKIEGQEGRVEIVRFDGRLLMSTAAHRQPGSTIRDFTRFEVADHPYGTLVHQTEEGWGALTAFRASRLYPLAVVVQLRQDYALRGWRSEARVMLAVVVPALLVSILLGVFFCRRQIELVAQRAESERLQRVNAAFVFTNAREGIVITDEYLHINEVNDAFSTITGYDREEVLGKHLNVLSSRLHDNAFYATILRALEVSGYWSGEIWNHRKDGVTFAGLYTISKVTDAHGRAKQYVILFSDITPLKEHERELEQIAHYDTLTRLPNRYLLADRLAQAMAQVLRHDKGLVVGFLDLDGFKAVNDAYGHDVGDQLLIALADRMKRVLREGDTLARIGGDEFVVVLLDLANLEASTPLLNRLLAAAAATVQLGELTLQVSASLGVTYFPQDKPMVGDQLLRQADQAMYQAKLGGKNRFHAYASAGGGRGDAASPEEHDAD